MALLNETLFTQIPLIALLFNVFLLFTLLSAKKDSSIQAFMGLLVAFIMWTGGAYLMRRQIYPGVGFWWNISLSGIFLVPYMYFLLVSAYTEQRGSFLKIILGTGTLVQILLNWFNVFMTSPVITMIDGEAVSDYEVKWTAVIPVLFTIVIFVCIGQMVTRTLREDGMPVIYLTPLLVGVLIMLVGIGINTIPGYTSWPTDTLACALNSICIYYAFYKKRFYALSQMTSKGSMYVISLVITGLSLTTVYSVVEGFLKNLKISEMNATLLLTVVCSAISIVIFMALNKLHDGLFVREQIRREGRVHDFSAAVNSTLKTDEIIQTFTELVKEEIAAEHVYVCMRDEGKKEYVSVGHENALERSLRLREDHPMVRKLQSSRKGFLYADFQRSAVYKSIWEEEKMQLQRIRAAYVLPFTEQNKVIGFVIFPEKATKKAYTYSEVNFIESLGSVASIALKNASLYRELEKEALLDPLTGLYNRRTLNKKLEEQFAEHVSPLTLLLLNLDDFSLYNELYGSEEGDHMLIRFAEILQSAVGTAGVIARYGGKEFAVLLPYCDALMAKQYAAGVQKMLADHIANSQSRIKKFLTFSGGICTYPNVAANANQLVSYANMAVFQVKQHGKNRVEIYDGRACGQQVKNDGIQELTSTIFALTAAIDAKDHYTFNHSQCVSAYAAALAEHSGMAKDYVEIIRQAGLLHDIGKIGIPDAILTKTGKLTPEEFSIMRQHVERSIEMIRHLPSLDYVIPAVLGHHEKFDGTGYPRGINGEEIPVSARCLSIADAFDAMVSKRSYKNKMPVEAALEEIERNLGTQFDPKLGRLFIQLVQSGDIQVINY